MVKSQPTTSKNAAIVIATVLVCITAIAAPRGEHSVSLIIIGDTQYPRDQQGAIGRKNKPRIKAIKQHHRSYVDRLNKHAATLKNYQGLIINGDLTEFGGRHQLAAFDELYMQRIEGPIYLGLGNHDYSNNIGRSDLEGNPSRMTQYLIDHVTGHSKVDTFDHREITWHTHSDSPKLTTGSLNYTWDIGQIRFVQLNNHPAFVHGWTKLESESAPHKSYAITPGLDWLQRVLIKAKQDNKYIVLNMHQPPSSWFKNDKQHAGPERKRFFQLLRDYPVTVVFVAHRHQMLGLTDSKAPAPLVFSGGPIFSTYTTAQFNLKAKSATVKHYRIENGKKIQVESNVFELR